MTANSAGGFSFALDHWKRLERFLILGSEGGTYYLTEQKLTAENTQCVQACLKENGKRTVDLIVDVSDKGRAHKTDPALYALAMAASPKLADKDTVAHALDVLPKVARIGTHLQHFAAFAQMHRGWGRSLRRAVAEWFTAKTPEQLAYQMVKYQSRDGWAMRDLLILSHPKPAEGQNALFEWAVKGTPADQLISRGPSWSVPLLVQGFELAKTAEKSKLIGLIRGCGLTREMIPTEKLTDPDIWAALLEEMPITAMIRNLGNMSKVGLLKPMSDASKHVCAKLRDVEAIRKSRVHPIAVLLAADTYGAGHGFKGKGEWTPVPQVIDALDDAFYLAFENAPSTGKRFYLGLDISGSMWRGSTISGTAQLAAGAAGGAMAMVTVKKESEYYAAGFTAGVAGGYHNSAMTPISLSPKMRLDDVIKNMRALEARMGSTDCALPMLDALAKNLSVDVFIIYTDNETWTGMVHPVQALETYRQKMSIPAKLVVCGMTSGGFSIADPNDAGMLDIVGFDASVPPVISNFVVS
jgi:60 kDa SS-A/Ro ribonucleoprotein